MLKIKKLLIILFLPLLLTSCARAQGALAPTGVASESEGLPPTCCGGYFSLIGQQTPLL